MYLEIIRLFLSLNYMYLEIIQLFIYLNYMYLEIVQFFNSLSYLEIIQCKLLPFKISHQNKYGYSGKPKCVNRCHLLWPRIRREIKSITSHIRRGYNRWYLFIRQKRLFILKCCNTFINCASSIRKEITVRHPLI